MAPNWRWCLKIGALIVVVDTLVVALGSGQAGDSGVVALLSNLDLFANLMLFSYVGYRTGRETGRATAGAEAGVVTSLLPAVAAAIYQLTPLAAGSAAPGDSLPLASRVIAAVAFNVVLGGVSAWLSSWLAGRSRPARS